MFYTLSERILLNAVMLTTYFSAGLMPYLQHLLVHFKQFEYPEKVLFFHHLI